MSSINYTIKQLADLAGITTRTLRYYDQIDLLKPNFLTDASYRIYSQKEVERLQHILFLRELDLNLEQIKQIMASAESNTLKLLQDHRQALEAKQQRLTTILTTLTATIADYKGENNMTNEEKFAAFKTDLVKKNDAQYGKEIREKHGETVIDASNKKMLNLSKTEYEKFKTLERTILDDLKKYPNLIIPSTEAETIFKNHQAWLKVTWPNYQIEAHRNLGLMYLADPRFIAYYDEQAGHGATVILNKIIQHYTYR